VGVAEDAAGAAERARGREEEERNGGCHGTRKVGMSGGVAR
jgi:hypothetical protein